MKLALAKKLWTVAVLFYINLLNYMDRYTIAGILPELQRKDRSGFHYHIDDKEGGLLQTSFIISFMLLSPVFGYLGDRYNRKYIMAVGILFWSCFVLVGSFSVNYPMLLATRALVGVGEASYATIAPTIIADLFTTEKRLRVLSVFYMAIPIGSALGYGVGSFVSSEVHSNFNDPYSWRWALRVTPGLGLLAVILILLIYEPPRGQSEDPRNVSGVKGSSGVKGYLKDILYLLKNKTFLLSTFGFAALTFSVGALAQWAPTLIYRISLLMSATGALDSPYSEDQASIGFGILTVIAGLVGTISGSELSKQISRWTNQSDCIVCAIGLLGGSPAMYLALTFGSYNLYLGWVLIFVGTFFFCLIWAPVGAILLYVVIPECRSTAEAIQILLIHVLGDASSPFIIGAISDALYAEIHHFADDKYSLAVGMTYALYLPVIISVIGGGLFLIATLTVDEDRKAVEAHVKNVNTRNRLDADQQQSLNSDVGENHDVRDIGDKSGSINNDRNSSSDCNETDVLLSKDKSVIN